MKTTGLSRHGFSMTEVHHDPAPSAIHEHAIHNCSLAKSKTVIDYPPCNAWADNAAYEAAPKNLAGLSIENFEIHAPGASDKIKATPPKVQPFNHYNLMKIRTILALSIALLTTAQSVEKPSSHTKGTPTGTPSGPLKPGEYWWKPQLSPSGPVVALVSIPEQTMHVYRNGILIGRSTVSTGSTGHATPGGVFNIIEKRQEHYSKKYNNAPMPNMQRLTWTGICMHSGNLPGHPASHGCIRMPFDFSQLFFTATEKGGTVVVGDGKTPVPHLASNPGLILAPKDFTPEMLRPLANNEYDWNPERSASGPVTMVVGAADKAIYIYRNGNPIGRAPFAIIGNEPLGNHLFTMLEGSTNRLSWLVPGRAARRWMKVTSSGEPAEADQIASRLRLNPEFAGKVYDILAPGTTVIVTDQPVVRNLRTAQILEN